jgi:hypothetical protein
LQILMSWIGPPSLWVAPSIFSCLDSSFFTFWRTN